MLTILYPTRLSFLVLTLSWSDNGMAGTKGTGYRIEKEETALRMFCQRPCALLRSEWTSVEGRRWPVHIDLRDRSPCRQGMQYEG